MTIEEIKALLNADELNKDKILEGIVEAVEGEKQKGISEYRKKDGELLKLKNSIKDIGYDPESNASLKDYVESLKGQVTKAQTADVTINTLNSKIAEIEARVKEEQDKRTTAEKLSKQSEISAKLQAEIGGKVYGSEYVIESLINNNVVDKVDGKLIWNVDGAPIEFDAGVKEFFKSNKDITKALGQPGSGDPGITKINGIDPSTISVEQASANVDALAKEYGVDL